MTKQPQDARAALDALQAQGEWMKQELERVRADLIEQEKRVDGLASSPATGEDGALAAAENQAGSLRAQIRRLEAGLRGTLNREEAARAVADEEEREKALVKLESLMAETSRLARTVEPKLSELAATVGRVCEAEDEALALARKHGIQIRSRAPRRYMIDLLRDRIARLKIPLPALLPILDVPGQGAGAKAAEALKGPWKISNE